MENYAEGDAEEEPNRPEGIGIGKGFKLDLNGINKQEQVGFH